MRGQKRAGGVGETGRRGDGETGRQGDLGKNQFILLLSYFIFSLVPFMFGKAGTPSMPGKPGCF